MDGTGGFNFRLFRRWKLYDRTTCRRKNCQTLSLIARFYKIPRRVSWRTNRCERTFTSRRVHRTFLHNAQAPPPNIISYNVGPYLIGLCVLYTRASHTCLDSVCICACGINLRAFRDNCAESYCSSRGVSSVLRQIFCYADVSPSFVLNGA